MPHALWSFSQDDGGGLIDRPQGYLPPTGGVAGNGLPILNWDQAAAQLTRGGFSWAEAPGEPITLTYGFRTFLPAAVQAQFPSGTTGFSAYNATQIAVVEQILALYEDVANIDFVRVGTGTSGPAAYSDDAALLFGNFLSGPGQFSAFAFLPAPGQTDGTDVEGDVWTNGSRDYMADPATFSRGAAILTHEIGHALGLLHASAYDGGAQSGLTYQNDADYWQDTAMFTQMSYFNETNTGASFLGQSPRGLMLHDIAAIQLLYGANMTTRTGSTTYGFNSNTERPLYSLTSAAQLAVFCIWDAGGQDTLDLSGYTQGANIDLREEAFSSAGGGTYNISIARGAVIEDAIGGGGADTILGNEVANVLYGRAGADNLQGAGGADTLEGGAGADTLNGGAGSDTASYANASTGVTVSLAAPASNTGDAAGDTFVSIENISGTPFADTLNGDGDSNTISGFGGADTINGGDGNDFLYGYSASASGAITSTAFTGGFAQPVAGAVTSADPGFLYIVEKASGIIWRVNDDTGARTQFLDIPNGQFNSDGEGGVLGLAFHPDYATNGRYFVFLTDAGGDLEVREYHRSSNPAVSETTFSIIWETPHPGQTNHNGGWIGFSPTDGYLYITTGDGGGGNDPNNNAQNLESLLGKILRIDVNSDAFPGDANRNYAIPANNPFVGVAGADEIWAYGLRNPWRIAFDPRNGNLYIADVGQSQREEVDFVASGAGGLNFGWRIMEGSLAHLSGPPGSPPAGHPSLVLPIYEYGRTIGTSITGGEVYVGAASNFVGQYVFADFGSGRLFSLSVVNGQGVDGAERTSQILGPLPSGVVDFVTGTDGALYAIGIGGTIWRLDFALGAEDVGDVLNGGAGNDFLDGGIGADTMNGGTGDDQYIVDNSGDVVTELSGEGTDTVYTRITYILPANVEALATNTTAAVNLYGNALNNVIVGNEAVNTLDGGAGADSLIGGGGNDLYIIDNQLDVVIELAAGGNDTIYTTFSYYQMGANVENVQITGGPGSYIVGNSVNNLLVGNTGADTLEGAGGADTLVGAAGDDFYIIADQDDVIIELNGGGNDTIYTSISFYQMGANVENLVMTGTGGTYATGNGLDNLIVGNTGADTLDGGAGGDFMVGHEGDDIYFVDNLGDRTVESAGEGTDAIYTSISWTIGADVENMVLTGSGNINGSGNELNNFIFGNSGNNIITGGAGADVLSGGAGADQFVYNAVSEGGDAISDFVSGVDDIVIDASAFGGGLVAGGSVTLISGANPTAGAGGAFLYDTDDGRLFWDADGAGGAGPVLVATLGNLPTLTANDFIIVA